jgi:hypothetical protein
MKIGFELTRVECVSHQPVEWYQACADKNVLSLYLGLEAFSLEHVYFVDNNSVAKKKH